MTHQYRTFRSSKFDCNYFQVFYIVSETWWWDLPDCRCNMYNTAQQLSVQYNNTFYPCSNIYNNLCIILYSLFYCYLFISSLCLASLVAINCLCIMNWYKKLYLILFAYTVNLSTHSIQIYYLHNTGISKDYCIWANIYKMLIHLGNTGCNKCLHT